MLGILKRQLAHLDDISNHMINNGISFSSLQSNCWSQIEQLEAILSN